MPVPRADVMTKAKPAGLPAVGVAMLVFMGERIGPPKLEDAKPGIRATNLRGQADTVLIEAMGYDDDRDGHTAIARAAQACIDAGLHVSFAPTGDSLYPARVVRRQ